MFYRDLGASRVVLARELSKDEIKEISSIPNLETEVFIHGAMCTCFSGRCALSNYVTNRDANRGGCAQVCRFAFDYKDNDKFTLATKDLNMASYIKDLIDICVLFVLQGLFFFCLMLLIARLRVLALPLLCVFSSLFVSTSFWLCFFKRLFVLLG